MIRTIVHFTDSSAFGGTEQTIIHLLAGLDRRRWRPVLFHHADPGLEPLLKKARHLQVELRTVPRIDTVRDIWNLPKLVRDLQAEHASVLHAHLIWPLSCKYALVAATLAGIPAVVATAHLYMDLSRQPLLHAQPRLIAACVDRYLAVSQIVAYQLCDDFGIPATKVQRVPNGIPLAAFNRLANPDLRAALSRGSSRPIVFMVARLEPRKNQRCVIEAAAQVTEATFVFAGDGPDRAALEAQVSKLGLGDRVLFLGHREDIPDLLACCDLFVLPSLSEGLPLSILEAMAAGKPVIASATGGNDELVKHGETGLLIRPADPPALAKAIHTMLSNPTFARRLAEAGRIQVHRGFSVQSMVAHVGQVYEEILAAPSSRCFRKLGLGY